jgi:hypothetical protein
VHQQRFGAKRPGRHDPDRLAAHESEVAQAPGDGVGRMRRLDVLHQRGRPLGELGKSHGTDLK